MASIQEDRVRIELGEHSYDVVVGTGLIERLGAFASLPRGTHAVVVSDATVDPLYGDAVQSSLRERFTSVGRVVLPAGEEHKDWLTLQRIFDALLGQACDRRTVLFALGRMPGWLALWEEMLGDKDQKIARPRQIYTGSGERPFIPIEKRR